MEKSAMMIPDTLELTDRAEVALHHLTSNVDPKLNYTPYFYLNMVGDPPSCIHENWDYGDITARYIDAIVSLRQMTGSKTGLKVERKLKQLLVSTFSKKDGLSYRLKQPWTKVHAGMFDQGRTMMALTTWYMETKDKKVLESGKRLVQGLWNIAIPAIREEKGYAYCYYPYSAYYPNGWDPTEVAEPTCYGGGCSIYSVVKFYEISGYPLADRLAERLVNNNVYESEVFSTTGDFRPKRNTFESGHFHSKTLTVLGVLKYAILHKRKDLVEWSIRAFEFALTQGTSFGWFPEGLGIPEAFGTELKPHSETCCTTDMIEIAILLAKNGYPQYWNQVERFTRNYLIESQISDITWMLQKKYKKRKDTPRERFTDAPEIIRGGFVGRCLPHDLIVDGFLMGCCCGAGARAIYQIWDNAVEQKAGKVIVHLLMNRRSSELEIQSFLPYLGKIVLKNIKGRTLSLRIPDWVNKKQITAEKNGTKCTFQIKKGYIEFQGLKPKDIITVQWLIKTIRKKESFLKWNFQVDWRGDTIIRIKPQGEKVPFYQREDMDSEQVPYREIAGSPNQKVTIHW